MLPGDRLVCAFVKPLTTGWRFKDWPLHVTIVPWFRLGRSSAGLVGNLRRPLVGVIAFRAKAAETAKFGRSGSRFVSLVEPFETFAELERRVRRTLKEEGAWLVDETTKRRREYRPHVTFQKSEHLDPGDSFYCDSLYIIEQKGNYKEIVGKVELVHE